jgi:AraC-like DNA-binding protein/quercetin dioxygenase-like cupin family protein
MRSGQNAEFTPVVQASHYPEVDRPVIAAAKEFAPRTRTGLHRHERAQILSAITGLMVASTEAGTWVVPSGYVLWIPPRQFHDVAMHGQVSMRTAYVRPAEAEHLPATFRVLAASPLLQASLVALASDSPAYDERGRGGHLAALVLDEIARTPASPFALAIPSDPRLAKLARALLEEPGSTLDLDGWADRIGASRRTLTRLFRAQTGLSFGAWRRRLRLLTAAARQADGEPMSRITASLGYRSLAAFRAMARREFPDRAEARRPI